MRNWNLYDPCPYLRPLDRTVHLVAELAQAPPVNQVIPSEASWADTSSTKGGCQKRIKHARRE
ncbi:hypothetical protein RSAG8_09698, partial [Rhizoctonia solani AG-8 WAC10335]